MGAPSSGKTTLCKFLANHFEEPWTHELGKQYWIDNQLNRRLTQKQLLEIAQLHILGEDKNMEEAKEFLFTDTNSITTYMFALDYYGQVDAELTELARQAEHRYDHFFVCDIDIPYEDTWERSGEVYRTQFQQLILDDLAIRGIKYTILSGDIQTRVAKVLSIL